LAYGGILSLLKYIKRYYEQQHITHVVIWIGRISNAL
jgi:hypothetical protein